MFVPLVAIPFGAALIVRRDAFAAETLRRAAERPRLLPRRLPSAGMRFTSGMYAVVGVGIICGAVVQIARTVV
jgi:hypothetical protein